MGILKIIKNDIGLHVFFLVQNLEKSVIFFISFSIAWKIWKIMSA